MTAAQFRALLAFRMCHDTPNPSVDIEAVDEFLNEQARERGFGNWVDAYHRFKP